MLQTSLDPFKKKKEARREESTMLSSVNSVPCSWQPETPGKGCHGEQTASFGGEIWSNFSLLPVNLWLGENTASRDWLGQRLPLPLLWDSFYLEMHVTFHKHCPFCYGCKMLGMDKKKGLHWSRKSNPEGREDSGKMTHQCSALIWSFFQDDFFFSILPFSLPPISSIFHMG